MADLLERGAAWLEDQRTRHMARTAYTIGFGLRVIALPQTNGQ